MEDSFEDFVQQLLRPAIKLKIFFYPAIKFIFQCKCPIVVGRFLPVYQDSNLVLKTVANYTYYKSGIFLSNLVDAFGRGPIYSRPE